MSKIHIYRGFSNVNEAISVLQNHTAGGEDPMSMEDWNVLYKDGKENTITNQMEDDSKARSTVTLTNSDRKGVIEYTLKLSTAQGFGTLCVIGACIEDTAILTYTVNSEYSIFLRTCEPIVIDSFALGWFYKNYSLPDKLNNFRPNTNRIPPQIDKNTQKILKTFIKQISLDASPLYNMIKDLYPIINEDC